MREFYLVCIFLFITKAYSEPCQKQKAPSQMFDRVLNTLLYNLDKVCTGKRLVWPQINSIRNWTDQKNSAFICIIRDKTLGQNFKKSMSSILCIYYHFLISRGNRTFINRNFNLNDNSTKWQGLQSAQLL